ncbi:uncharacterized protein LOC141705025 [Apium graveolens]|uniref:uncharacterized protein LOC141705025 n=1 Tax=Apium graveolens TaxID=4045 RepID=UPI003D7B1B1D
MVNQESFMRQRIAKANEQLKKQCKDNREKEMIEVMYQCLTGKIGLQNLMIPDLNDLGWLIDHKLKEIYKELIRYRLLRKEYYYWEVGSGSGSGCGSGSAACNVKGKGVANCIDGTEEKALEGEMEAMQQPQQRPPWFSDWINSNSGNSSTDQMLNQQQHCQNLGFRSR